MQSLIASLQSCLSAWPKLCARLWSAAASDEADGASDAVSTSAALSSVERMLRLRDVAPSRTVQPAVEPGGGSGDAQALLGELSAVLDEVYGVLRRCEALVAAQIARGDAAGACAFNAAWLMSPLDAVALVREVAMHFDTDYQMRADLVARLGGDGGADGDERQVLRLVWLALPTPLPEARRFQLQQQLAELSNDSTEAFT